MLFAYIPMRKMSFWTKDKIYAKKCKPIQIMHESLLAIIFKIVDHELFPWGRVLWMFMVFLMYFLKLNPNIFVNPDSVTEHTNFCQQSLYQHYLGSIKTAKSPFAYKKTVLKFKKGTTLIQTFSGRKRLNSFRFLFILLNIHKKNVKT